LFENSFAKSVTILAVLFLRWSQVTLIMLYIVQNSIKN